MENASKALLIAGGVLIAIMIISLLLAMYGRVANMKQEQQEQIEREQLIAFNAEYEAFNKKVMYGTDVITLLNKVQHNNEKYKNRSDYKIDIIVKIKDGESETIITSGKDLLAIDDSETRIFKCTSINYNELGRVSTIEIETR